MNELKNCPFCGGEATIDDITTGDETTLVIGCGDMECPGCDAVVSYGLSSPDYLIEKWNKRAHCH